MNSKNNSRERKLTKSIRIRLEEKTVPKLKKVAKEKHMDVSALVRYWIDLGIKKK